MIKLFSLKQQKEAGAAAAGGGAPKKKTSAAQLRAMKDHNELQLPSACELLFDNPDDVLNFRLVLKPREGIYQGGRFVFSFKISAAYPHEAPKVHCDTRVYHPNIDLEGNICLNILREDWKPVLNIQSIIYGLVFLFLEPNMDDPLNKEAAGVMRDNRAQFERNVTKAMRGGYVAGSQFDRCLA